MSNLTIELFILAAGESSRVGRSKPLLPFGSQTLLARLCEIFRGAGIDAITVVAREEDSPLHQEAQRIGIRCIKNNHPESGMTSSIVVALAQSTAEWTAFTPCDLPFLTNEIIRACVSELGANTNPLQPAFQTRRGHPVFLHKDSLKQLSEAIRNGDTLRDFLRTQPVRSVQITSDLAFRDLDTPEDYESALRELGLEPN